MHWVSGEPECGLISPPEYGTHGLTCYLMSMGPKGKAYFPLYRQGENGKIEGKVLGPDGQQMIKIDGPHSAPTQHVHDYHTVMVVGGGIGVTPVASTLKSIVCHLWKHAVGNTRVKPSNAYFYWVISHGDLDSFR